MPADRHGHKLHIQEKSAATPTTQRSIQVWESAFNATKLSDNKWNFQIAKSVNNGDGNKTFNVVWQSKSIAPNTLIVWQDVYALNWTAVVPAPGVSVTISGEWQLCKLGESYDLDNTGFWTKSQGTAPDKTFMNVGNIQYKYPGVDGIHIVIGVQNPRGNFDIIYVDPTSLPPGSSAKYQPQELVKWWYQVDNQTSTMISSASTGYGGIDLSAPAKTTLKYYYSTTFNYDSGTWVTSEDEPPQSLYDPPQDLANIQDTPLGLCSIWPVLLKIMFKVVLGAAVQTSASAKLGALLRVQYKDVSVTVIDDLNFQVNLGAPKAAKPNSSDAIGSVTEDIITNVSDLLQFEVDDGDLPSDESWDIQKIQGGE
ncbi:hypothetical protein V8E54_008591 [Elaphomyces granulatus]|jgi:hypothetical protein